MLDLKFGVKFVSPATCSTTFLQIFLWMGILETSMKTSLQPDAYLAIILPFHSPSIRTTLFFDPGGKTSAVTWGQCYGHIFVGFPGKKNLVNVTIIFVRK
jgi:hypothetical protein